MSLAIIKTGGKQYIVSPGQKIKVEKLAKSESGEVVFDEVLLLDPSTLQGASGQAGSGQVKLEIGTPFVKDAKVIGKVLREDKGKKVIVFKFKAKKRYKVKKGHRQIFSEVEILKI